MVAVVHNYDKTALINVTTEPTATGGDLVFDVTVYNPDNTASNGVASQSYAVNWSDGSVDNGTFTSASGGASVSATAPAGAGTYDAQIVISETAALGGTVTEVTNTYTVS